MSSEADSAEYGADGATLAEVAVALGVSRERAFQIERIALRKFRAKLLDRLKQMNIEPADLRAAAEAVEDARRSTLGRLIG